MKIINKTNWRTDDLKKLLTAAFNEDDRVEGKYKYRDRLRIEIVYSKGPRRWVVEAYKKRNLELPVRRLYSGYAFYNGNFMKLRIPKEKIDKEILVKIFIHEAGHIRGFRHSGMRRWIDIEASWAKDDKYQMRQKETKVKPKVDLQLKRYEHILTLLKDKKSQLKRLQNQIKKWNQKRKYYESVLVASGKIKKEDIG